MMDVQTLRYRVTTRDIDIDGVRITYDGPPGDVDMNDSETGTLIAWVSGTRENKEDALKVMNFNEDANGIKVQRVKTFFGAIPPRTKLPILLRINRSGEFIATDETTPSQCGKVGARRYRYEVSIEASNEHLTEQGFVMENLWVAEYFTKKYETDKTICASCEEMAQEAIAYFHNLFDEKKELEGVKPTRVIVRIHGSDVSFIEGEWKA